MEKGLLARTPRRGDFPRQRVELIRDADPVSEVNRLFRDARLDRRAAHRAAHARAGGRDARREPARAPRRARRDGAARRRGQRGEGGGQRGDGRVRPGILPGGAGRGPGDPRPRVQPPRRADHRRERGAAARGQRPGGAADRHQRGLGRARPGLARQRHDRPRGAPGHEQPGRRLARRGLVRGPRPAGALQPVPGRAGGHAVAAAARGAGLPPRAEHGHGAAGRDRDQRHRRPRRARQRDRVGRLALRHPPQRQGRRDPLPVHRAAARGRRPHARGRAPRAVRPRPASAEVWRRSWIHGAVHPTRLARVGGDRRRERLDPGGARARRSRPDRGRRRPADSPARLLPVVGLPALPDHARDRRRRRRAGSGTIPGHDDPSRPAPRPGVRRRSGPLRGHPQRAPRDHRGDGGDAPARRLLDQHQDARRLLLRVLRPRPADHRPGLRPAVAPGLARPHRAAGHRGLRAPSASPPATASWSTTPTWAGST